MGIDLDSVEVQPRPVEPGDPVPGNRIRAFQLRADDVGGCVGTKDQDSPAASGARSARECAVNCGEGNCARLAVDPNPPAGASAFEDVWRFAGPSVAADDDHMIEAQRGLVRSGGFEVNPVTTGFA